MEINEKIKDVEEKLSPLVGTEIDNLKLPVEVAGQFEPSQFGTIVGTLMDALLPSIALKKDVGLIKAKGILGEREGYPDFTLGDDYRIELKGLFKDNLSLSLKRPPTPREASARLTQKVTIKNVEPHNDFLLLLCYELSLSKGDGTILVPRIVDMGVFPVIELVKARDFRMEQSGGIWFGNFETPTILSHKGKTKLKAGTPLNRENYGRKESEGYDFNEDTNFGKMKRIPYKPLQSFLKKHGLSFTKKGEYPSAWEIN